MRKLSLALLLLLLIITGCTHGTEPLKTTSGDNNQGTSILDVRNAEDKADVSVLGVITVIDTFGNFYIQDESAGIYVTGMNKVGLTLDNSFLGKTVHVSGIKSVKSEITYIGMRSLADFSIENDHPLTIISNKLTSFDQLNTYDNKLVTLQNVNLVIENQVLKVKDQNDHEIVKILDVSGISAQSHVDVTGVYVHNSTDGNVLVINGNASIMQSQILSDAERLEAAKELLVLTSDVMVDYPLPYRYGDITVSWSDNNDVVYISSNRIERNDNLTTTISFKLTATLSLGDETPVTKDFNVTLKKIALWSLDLTKFNYYDGPAFPSDGLNKDFWTEGGVQKVEFRSCVDGDTAHFLVTEENGSKQDESIRFLGVNTKETHGPNVPGGVEVWGYPGSDYTCNVLKHGKEFYLEGDTVEGARDKYDRLLGWVWVDGQLLQYNLMKLGLADDRYTYFTGKPAKYDDLIRETQVQAKADKIGEWSVLHDPYWDYTNNRVK